MGIQRNVFGFSLLLLLTTSCGPALNVTLPEDSSSSSGGSELSLCQQPGSTSGTFAGGQGIAGDPFVICDLNQLLNVQLDLGAVYELGGDINCDGTVMEPIGFDLENPELFKGTFDGKGHKIHHCTIQGKSGYKLGTEVAPSYTTGVIEPWEAGGLFSGLASGATVKNLVLDNISINGFFGNVGCLAGIAIDDLDPNVSATDPILINAVDVQDCSISGARDYSSFLVGHVILDTSIQFKISESSVQSSTFQAYFSPSDEEITYSPFTVDQEWDLKWGGTSVGGFIGEINMTGIPEFIFTQNHIENSSISMLGSDPANNRTSFGVGGMIGWLFEYDADGAVVDFNLNGLDTVTIDGGNEAITIGGAMGGLKITGQSNVFDQILLNNLTILTHSYYSSGIGGFVGEMPIRGNSFPVFSRIAVKGLQIIDDGSEASNIGGLFGIFVTSDDLNVTPSSVPVSIEDVFVKGSIATNGDYNIALSGGIAFLWSKNDRPISFSKLYTNVVINSGYASSYVGGLVGQFYKSNFGIINTVFADFADSFAEGPITLGEDSYLYGAAFGNVRNEASYTNVGYNSTATLVGFEPNSADLNAMTGAQIITAATAAFTDTTFWKLPFNTGVDTY